jgi:murein tripeptide amidase MpaA
MRGDILRFDNSRYYDHKEVESIVQSWAASHSELVKAYSIGETHQGRPIWVLEISAPTEASNDEKPGFFVDANTHAEEITGTTAALQIAFALIDGYGNDEVVTRLLEETTFYIVPRLNPDGAEIVMTEPFYEHIGNGRFPLDDIQVGSGLHYADVNRDGIIVDMRIPDRNGEWKISKKDSRVMVQREPHEIGGEYYRVLPEGYIKDYDGVGISIPRPRDGNLNRQYPFGWGPEGDEYGAGAYPTSEPEAEAIVRFHESHPNIAGALNFHTNGGLLLPPSHIAGEQMPLSDSAVIRQIGKLGEKAMGYPLIENEESFNFPGAHHRMGTATDYLYGQRGIINYVIEFWDVIKECGIEKASLFPLAARSEEENLKLLKWSDEKLDGNGFMPWTPFEHPQLGAVEIGGWRRLYMFRNPPEGDYLKQACLNATVFALQFSRTLPRIGVEDLVVIDKGEGVFKIEVNVVNEGFLPTYLTRRAVDIQTARTVTANLSLPDGMELLSGMERIDLGHLEGRSERSKRYSRFLDWGVSARRAEWVIHVRTPLKNEDCPILHVESQKAGSIHKAIRLE